MPLPVRVALFHAKQAVCQGLEVLKPFAQEFMLISIKRIVALHQDDKKPYSIGELDL